MQEKQDDGSVAEHANQERTMVRELPTFNLRMPKELRQAIEKAAEASGRSLNAEIIYRLQGSLERPVSRSGYRISEPHREDLSELEGDMLQIFRRLKPDRQLAMLTLFK